MMNTKPQNGTPALATARSSFIIHHSSFSSGFTLIELMVTIMIIAILAGIFLGALAAAQRAANVAHTQALITKLHGQLMLRYESYRTRRLPISSNGLTGQQAAVHRLAAMRELMRMELPDRYSDLMAFNAGGIPGSPITTGNPDNPYNLPNTHVMVPAFFTWDASIDGWWPGNPRAQPSWMPISAVNLSYRRRCNTNSQKPSAAFEDAECLYLIITTGLADGTMAGQQISPDDVGDADGDGMPEFRDAWGNPIRFVRWAPAFVSDLQPAIVDSANKHDPFDPLKIQHPFPSFSIPNNHMQTVPSSGNAYNGIALYPLIYSAGPDRVGDIQRPPVYTSGPYQGYTRPSADWFCRFITYIPKLVPGPLTPGLPQQYSKVYDPYSPDLLSVGAPADVETTNMVLGPDGDFGNDDNIHNHLIGQ